MPSSARSLWYTLLDKVSRPVVESLSKGRLRIEMPVEGAHPDERKSVTHLEAFGRTLAGLAPWLSCPDLEGDEAMRRDEILALSRRALAVGVDPSSPDFLNFSEHHQPIVDAAFLAHGLLRGKRVLWDPLEPSVKGRVIAALKATRTRKPGYCNWLLFSAMVEAFLASAGESDWDRMRVDYALRSHQEWYKGDGVYGDGKMFAWDYYNSFVIQPMLLDILATLGDFENEWGAMRAAAEAHGRRYAQVLERFIAADGSYPPIGRSIAYRCGAFQHLAQAALRHALPAEIPPAQVRCALTSVIRRTLEAPNTFDARGWLRIGLCGAQPSLGEAYISTGSLYLCSTAFLPLGLPPSDPFWSSPDLPWTQVRLWRGEDLPADHGQH